MAVIGGGLAGLSTAYHLAKSGCCGVVVIEREKKIGAHASGNNAGMIRQTVSDPVLANLAAEGRNKLSRLGGPTWKDLAFRSNGSILLAQEKDQGDLKKIHGAGLKNRIICRELDKKEISKVVPELERANFDKALFCPTDALVDVGALLQGLRRELKTLGVRIFLGHPLTSIHRTREGFILSAGNQNLTAEKIVNAAGAWVGEVAKQAGASLIPLKPYLRHLYESKGFGLNSEIQKWPFVWDLSRGLYFRPVKKELLLSPCDKRAVSLGHPFEKKEIQFEDLRARKALSRKLKSFSPYFNSLKLGKKKIGLRTMAPDGRFVIGEDPKLRNFFWVAGLGGHGVTTSFSVGRLAADLVLGKKNSRFSRWASPKRFFKDKHASKS